MIDHRAHHDGLSHAIFEALESTRAVAQAFRQVEATGDLNWERLEPIRNLLRGNLQPDSFSEEVVLRLQAFAEAIEPTIAIETRTSIHFDECCASGAWEETHLTERGHALNRLHKVSNVLGDRISTVVDIRKTQLLTTVLSE